MPREHHYYVYILASRSRTLYVGVTNNLIVRVTEHRDGEGSVFTRKYNIHRLVYYEHFNDVHLAIAREKQMKNWTRAKKVSLIEAKNPVWEDLFSSLFVTEVPRYREPEGCPKHPAKSSGSLGFARDDTPFICGTNCILRREAGPSATLGMTHRLFVVAV